MQVRAIYYAMQVRAIYKANASKSRNHKKRSQICARTLSSTAKKAQLKLHTHTHTNTHTCTRSKHTHTHAHKCTPEEEGPLTHTRAGHCCSPDLLHDPLPEEEAAPHTRPT